MPENDKTHHRFMSCAQGGVPWRACAARLRICAYAFPIPPPSLLSMFALILNWAAQGMHPTSTTPTNNNNHVELAHAQLVGEVAKKLARASRAVNTYNNCA